MAFPLPSESVSFCPSLAEEEEDRAISPFMLLLPSALDAVTAVSEFPLHGDTRSSSSAAPCWLLLLLLEALLLKKMLERPFPWLCMPSRRACQMAGRRCPHSHAKSLPHVQGASVVGSARWKLSVRCLAS